MRREEKQQLLRFFSQYDGNDVSNGAKMGFVGFRRGQLRDAGVFTDWRRHVLSLGMDPARVTAFAPLPADAFSSGADQGSLQGRGLCGALDLSACADLIGIDLAHNNISALDVSAAEGLLSLDIRDNLVETLDFSENPALRSLRCQDNRISFLDLASNAALGYLDCTGNPLIYLRLPAPTTTLVRVSAESDKDDALAVSSPQPFMELSADDGGFIGVRTLLVRDQEGNETGERAYACYAYPREDCSFGGWYDGNGVCVSHDLEWTVPVGSTGVLVAHFIGMEKERAIDPASPSQVQDYLDTLRAIGQEIVRGVGKATATLTLAGSLLLAGPAISGGVQFDNPPEMIQSFDQIVSSPSDDGGATSLDDEQGHPAKKISKWLLGALTTLLVALLALVVACAAGIFDRIGGGASSGGDGAGETHEISLLLVTGDEESAGTVSPALVDIRNEDGETLVDDRSVPVDTVTSIDELADGTYRLVFERMPEADDGSLFHPDGDTIIFEVDDSDETIRVELHNAG